MSTWCVLLFLLFRLSLADPWVPFPRPSLQFRAVLRSESPRGVLEIDVHEKSNLHRRLVTLSTGQSVLFQQDQSVAVSVNDSADPFECRTFPLDSFDLGSWVRDPWTSASLVLYDLVWRSFSSSPDVSRWSLVNQSCPSPGLCVYAFRNVWTRGPLEASVSSLWTDYVTTDNPVRPTIEPVYFEIHPTSKGDEETPKVMRVYFSGFSLEDLEDDEIVLKPNWNCDITDRNILPDLPLEFTYNVTKWPHDHVTSYNVFYSRQKSLQRIEYVLENSTMSEIYDFQSNLVFINRDGVCEARPLKERFVEGLETLPDTTAFPTPWQHFNMADGSVVLNSIYVDGGVNYTKYTRKMQGEDRTFSWDFISKFQNGRKASSYDIPVRIVSHEPRGQGATYQIEFLPDGTPEGTFDLSTCKVGVHLQNYMLQFTYLPDLVEFDKDDFIAYFRMFLENTFKFPTVRIGNIIVTLSDKPPSPHINVEFVLSSDLMYMEEVELQLTGPKLAQFAKDLRKMYFNDEFKWKFPMSKGEVLLQGKIKVLPTGNDGISNGTIVVIFISLAVLIYVVSFIGAKQVFLAEYFSRQKRRMLNLYHHLSGVDEY